MCSLVFVSGPVNHTSFSEQLLEADSTLRSAVCQVSFMLLSLTEDFVLQVLHVTLPFPLRHERYQDSHKVKLTTQSSPDVD